jgi:hypothetical protein
VFGLEKGKIMLKQGIPFRSLTIQTQLQYSKEFWFDGTLAEGHFS